MVEKLCSFGIDFSSVIVRVELLVKVKGLNVLGEKWKCFLGGDDEDEDM